MQLRLNKTAKYYDCVEDMKNDKTLKVGDIAVTLGYYEANDGNGAEYKIKLSTEKYGETLNNNLIAELIAKDDKTKIKIKQNKYKDVLGICCHTTWIEQFKRDIQLWKNLNVQRVRFDARWSEIEKTKNVYDFTPIKPMLKILIENNITPYIIFNNMNSLYTNDTSKSFANEEITNGYINFSKSVIDFCKSNNYNNLYFEIYNEPNMHYCNLNNYVKAIKEIYTYSKTVNANNKIVIGVTAGTDGVFLEEMFKKSSLNFTDYVSIHPYSATIPEDLNNNIFDIQLLIKKYAPNNNVQLIQGECGYSTVDKDKVTSGGMAIATDEQRGKYLTRMILNHMKLGINISNIYAAYNPEQNETNSEHWFRIMNLNGTPTKTYNELLRIYNLLKNYSYIKEVYSTNTAYILLFKDENENEKYIGWTTKEREEITIKNKQYILTDSVQEIKNFNYIKEKDDEINNIYSILSKIYNINPKQKNDINGADAYLQSDFNNITTEGIYRYYGSPINSPRENISNTDYGFLCCHNKSNYFIQIVYSMESMHIFYRKQQNDVWKEYKEIANIDDIDFTYNSVIRQTDNLNSIFKQGIYNYHGGPLNHPTGDTNEYGILIVFQPGSSYTIQVLYYLGEQRVFIRTNANAHKEEKETLWSEWKEQFGQQSPNIYNYRNIEKTDLNNCIKTGYYNFNGGPLNNPEYSLNNQEYGILSVLNSGYYVSQQCHCFKTDTLWIRNSTDFGATFKDWKQI